MATAIALTALLVATGTAEASCVVSPRANGSGYHPPSSAASLPQTSPRPGPDILYRPAPRAPQLENTGVWRAEPILVSGASAYRGGEFVYQDYLYDDTALTYPDQPDRYAGNAADLVEIRVKPLARGLAIRITYNSMLDPDVAATTIALGSSAAPRAMPHDAGASMPAEVFVTVHGCTGDIVAASDGASLPYVPRVAVDRGRRQVDVEVPYGAFDPRGQRDVRLGAAAGLWDVANDRYQRPDPNKPAFFNVGFRFAEPLTGFRDSRQNSALATGDLSAFSASVDFVKLARGVNDDAGVPRTGMLSRIYPSHFETAQGRGSSPGLADAVYPGYTPCEAPCAPTYAGQLQPYGIYVPKTPAGTPLGLTLFHHGCSENYTSFLARAARFADLDGASLGVTTEARGECIWEFDQAGADLYEVWADVARHYRLDPDRVTLSGQSLGGYATWKNAVQFPDLYAAVAPNIGPPSASGDWVGRPVPAQSGEGTVIYPLLSSLRNVPVVHWVGIEDELVPFTATKAISDTLDQLGYRHSFRAFTGDHVTTGGELASYDPMGEYIAHRRVDRDPAHVTYVFSGFMNQPKYGLTSDHAYWLSDIRLRDDGGLGTLDVFSHGYGVADPPAQPAQQSAGAYPTSLGPPVPYYGTDLTWGATPGAPAADALDITATNVRAVTVDTARARIDCNATIDVKSDGPLAVTLAGCHRTVTPRQAPPGR